jgi:hypothetical protein
VSLLEDFCGLYFVICYCQKLTAEAREPRVKGTSAVKSRYQATTGEDTAD